MFTTLRARLWWSYALVVGVALAVVAVVFLIYIIKNPSTYRQASARLSSIEATMIQNEKAWSNLPQDALQPQLERFGSTIGTRMIVFNADQQVIADSQQGSGSPIQMPALPRLRPASVLQDQAGNSWLYEIRPLKNGRWLMVTVPRPQVPILSILTDELVLPIAGAGIVALVLSLLIAYWLASWVGKPLQEIIFASRQMPARALQALVPHGPREVQELTLAFNEMNHRVQISQKSQRDFVANVSHELKTPLTSVQGFAQALLDGTASTPEARQQAAHVIHDEAERMHRMVLDLLDLARLDAGTADLKRAPVDLTALLNNIGQKFAPQARAAQVAISVDASNLPLVTGDADRLAQVFTNLVDNALKYTPPGGQIRLRTQASGSEASVEVRDTGNGIDPQALPHIFDRFYQADTARAGGKKHGAGLGLTIAKEIIQAHGGTISVRSAPGYGSEFTVRLPVILPTDTTAISRKK
jgi:signal transduction histidine kinase